MPLEYAEHRPSPTVSQYVECYWTLRGHLPSGDAPQRIIPDGRSELVWNFADPFIRHRASAASHRQPASVLVGQITSPILLEPTGRIDLIGARFTAAGLGAFLGSQFPMLELTDADVAMDDVLGSRLRSFREDAGAFVAPDARVRLLDERLSFEIRHTAPVNPRVRGAMELILAAQGNVRVDAVSAAAGVSGRQLERIFLSTVGMGPKRLSRIVRLQHLVARVSGEGPRAWARIAVECGYYDQAHLLRDFRELTGETPGSFFRQAEPSLAEVFLRPG